MNRDFAIGCLCIALSTSIFSTMEVFLKLPAVAGAFHPIQITMERFLVGGLCLITTAVVVLFRYVRRGKLYILGGAAMALGGLLHLSEWLMVLTFDGGFTGWSLYPLVGLALVGGLLIYVAISPSARETIERKLFF